MAVLVVFADGGNEDGRAPIFEKAGAGSDGKGLDAPPVFFQGGGRGGAPPAFPRFSALSGRKPALQFFPFE